jgi:threonine/homoserine/homoserine lactone efflux protein
MGFLTNALNPKIALFYLSVFSSFLHPERGHVAAQSLVLGSTQIGISLSVNFVILLAAAQTAQWLGQRPLWITVQKWMTATVLTTFACRLAISHRR